MEIDCLWTDEEAAKCRDAGIVIFAIGIGTGIPVTELNEMATDPDSDYVFSVSGFSALSGVSTAFQAKACVPPSAIDGQYGNWATWGGCSVSCGGGSRSRSRDCDSPPPANGGNDCTGLSSETEDCGTSPCPVDGQYGSWATWGGCSVTCGGGSRSRSRNCDSPSPDHGGKDCVGPSSEAETCGTTPCPVDGQYGNWATWGGCSVSCGGGSRSRSRNCDSPKPAHGGSDCTGPSSETEDCGTSPCPVHGGWGAWQAWGACSVTCMGVGIRGRVRDCDSPKPLHGGNQCAPPGDETQACDRRLTLCSAGNGWGKTVYSTTPGAPVDGGWSIWGAWSTCTKTCGAGMRLRQRSCNSPVPQFGGVICSGDYITKEICGNVPCSNSSSYVQTCPERFFDCASGNITCVHYLKKCDCIPDCDDASDEDMEYAGCVASTVICQNTAHSLSSVSIFTFLLLLLAAILPVHVTCSDVTM